MGINDAEAGNKWKKKFKKIKRKAKKSIEESTEKAVDTAENAVETATLQLQKLQEDSSKVYAEYKSLDNKNKSLKSKIASIVSEDFPGLFNISLKNQKLGPINLFLANDSSKNHPEATQHVHESISLGDALSLDYDEVKLDIEYTEGIANIFGDSLARANSCLNDANEAIEKIELNKASEKLKCAVNHLAEASLEAEAVGEILALNLNELAEDINASANEFFSEVNKFSAALDAAVLGAGNRIDELLVSHDKVESTMLGIIEHNLPGQLLPPSLSSDEAKLDSHLEGEHSGGNEHSESAGGPFKTRTSAQAAPHEDSTQNDSGSAGNEHSNPVEEVNRKTRAFAQTAKDVMGRMRSESNAIASDLHEMQATVSCMSEKLGKAANRKQEALELIQKHKYDRVPNKLDSALHYIDRTMSTCGAFRKFKDLNVV